jgi:dynein assembly factor 2
VAKTSKELKGDKSSKEKLFLNIVQSDKIDVPSKTSTPKGNNWSVPYSLGPPHMEKDKNGENAPCFDCCFHPDAIASGVQHKEFKDLLVHTAIDGVQGMYKKQGQDVSETMRRTPDSTITRPLSPPPRSRLTLPIAW